MRTRYLTKSRFKLACECPTKLYYTGKSEYPNQSTEDPFLAALAEGGFQVGELAKAYHPMGHDIEALDYATSLQETNRLLRQENVTIFEAAIQYKNFFIRIDVLRKNGNTFDLVEVKAKSFENKEEFYSASGRKISNAWKPYLIDVAFQEYVLRKAFPEVSINTYLMLADKNSQTTVDGLNQIFKIFKNDSGRTQAKAVEDITPERLGDPILIEVDVKEPVRELQGDDYVVNGVVYNFEDYAYFLAEKYIEDEKIPPRIDCSVCGNCEFRATEDQEASGLISGFKSCWKEVLDFSEQDFNTPSVMELWSFRNKQKFLESGRFFLKDVTAEDFDLGKPSQARQWLQIHKTVSKDPSPWFDAEGYKEELESWIWPLHFIDFETSAVAIPFNKGLRPYEVVSFQFSHHKVNKNGSIEHANEFLLAEPGVFPNFCFVRALKKVLSNDHGTIFRYAAHENTVLNHIKRQLEDYPEHIEDRNDLIEWIESITHNSETGWEGPRNMVDQWKLVKSYFYQLDMKGSNSIKKVLPAVLNSSKFLQDKYSKAIYRSNNFTEQAWIQWDENGNVLDPYKLLPSIFEDVPQEELEKVPSDGVVADGGAAMTAYARLQFADISLLEREAICKALLRYCELDTFAMVMIFEAWQDMLSQ